MRKSILPVLGIGFICIFLSCSNDLDLLAPSNAIPIVYGLLTNPDTGQYIRVERAFLASGNPQQAALVVDSIYFDRIQVYINDNPLTELRGSELAPVRDLGYFISKPNVLYYLSPNSIPLSPGSLYTLTINEGEKELASAQTRFTSSINVFSPRKGDLLSFERANVTYRWSNQEDHALYDVRAIIHIEEQVDQTFNEIDLEWIIVRDFEVNRLEFDGDLFYEFLGSQLKVIPGITRILVGIDLVFEAAGKEYERFRSINQNNSGITGFQNLPQFSNIENGLGLFSSRSHEVLAGLQLTSGSIELLKSHPAMTSMGF